MNPMLTTALAASAIVLVCAAVRAVGELIAWRYITHFLPPSRKPRRRPVPH